MNYIIEVANTHGGDLSYLESLIDEFSHHDGMGMKFQPLHPDRIAIEQYQWYNVYQELVFSLEEWNRIIQKAATTKKVWLDMFDTYGVDVLRENAAQVHGIKLQASVLYNYEVIEALSQMDCSRFKLILNISAIEMQDIEERLDFFKNKIQPGELLLEVGFQSYPTKLEDAGLSKIASLKNNLSYPIVFADHVEGKSNDALTLPLMAAMKGADYIEKHVMHSTLKAKYDHFSSITVDRFNELVTMVESYTALDHAPFINNSEREYLNKSIQKPLAKHDLAAGSLISVESDLLFRRNDNYGLSVKEVTDLQARGHILAKDVKAGETLTREHFKKATVGTIIAGRLKSSRLKRKALLNIGTLPSVEKCIQSCLKFSDTQYTVLATSDNEEDSELSQYTYADVVKFVQGHPDDVIQRYLDTIDQYDIDVVIRVTADMPYVSWEIADYLLEQHFKSGADYTAAQLASVGTDAEVVNAAALREVKKHFPNADFSEYMTWYFQNNQEYFHVNLVDLPEQWVRDYRLTIDYQEDLDMMNALQKHLDEQGLDGSIIEVFQFLDENKDVVDLNSHIGLKYKTDQKLIDTLNKETKIQVQR